MILNWNDFNKWRETSLEYHKMISEHNYTNALTFFEYVRQYFNAKGFPPTEKKTKTEEFICAPWYGDYDRCDRGCGGTCLFLCRETKLS